MIALRVGTARVRVHPLMALFPLAAAMLGLPSEAFALLLSLMCHETAHLLAARALGVRVEELRLMPFGASIALGNPYLLRPGQLLGVAAAGPLANLLLLAFCGALANWQILGAVTALAMLRVNALLMLFNLLPALPLDGGRMLFALLSPKLGREKALHIGIVLGVAVAAALLGWALWAQFAHGQLNLSLAFSAVFILASLPEERRALSDTRVRSVLGALRPMRGAMPMRLCAVDAGCTVSNALRAADPTVPTLFAVFRGDRLAHLTDERALLDVAVRTGGETPVSEALRSTEGKFGSVQVDSGTFL